MFSKCNNLLSKKGKEAFCPIGEMYLSQRLTERLEECYVERTKTPREFELSYEVGGTWFCPSCGIQILEENKSLRCRECGLCLNEFIYQLIEFCSHKK